MISFLEIAEAKAETGNETEMLKGVRRKLADLYGKLGRFEKRAELLGKMNDAAQSAEEKELILPELLDAYLRGPNVKGAADVVNYYLLGDKDLDPNSVVVGTIDNYLSYPPAGADPNAVLGKVLVKIEIGEGKPKWAEQMKHWGGRVGLAEDPNKP